MQGHAPFPAAVLCRLEQYKWRAVVTEIKRIHKEGRPVLVGTTSVEKSELLSEMLAQEGIKHQVGGWGSAHAVGTKGTVCWQNMWAWMSEAQDA